jgi:hypothetical protein
LHIFIILFSHGEKISFLRALRVRAVVSEIDLAATDRHETEADVTRMSSGPIRKCGRKTVISFTISGSTLLRLSVVIHMVFVKINFDSKNKYMLLYANIHSCVYVLFKRGRVASLHLPE